MKQDWPWTDHFSEYTKKSYQSEEKHEQPTRKMGKDMHGYFIDTDKEAQMAKKIYIKCSTSFCDLEYISEPQWNAILYPFNWEIWKIY